MFNDHHDTGLKDTGKPFKAVNSHLDFFLKDLSALPDYERDDLVKDRKNEELEEIVKNCDHNKSPGLDGLSYEFYQESFSIIKEDLLKIFQCQLNTGRIIESNKDGVTRLVPRS